MKFVDIMININPYLNFLTLITDMMTRRLPKMAATIINIIIDAVKTVIKTLIHSWSIISSVLLLLLNILLIVEFGKVSFVINSWLFIVICSLLNDEEDDKLGDDDIWDNEDDDDDDIIIYYGSDKIYVLYSNDTNKK